MIDPGLNSRFVNFPTLVLLLPSSLQCIAVSKYGCTAATGCCTNTGDPTKPYMCQRNLATDSSGMCRTVRGLAGAKDSTCSEQASPIASLLAGLLASQPFLPPSRCAPQCVALGKHGCTAGGAAGNCCNSQKCEKADGQTVGTCSSVSNGHVRKERKERIGLEPTCCKAGGKGGMSSSTWEGCEAQPLLPCALPSCALRSVSTTCSSGAHPTRIAAAQTTNATRSGSACAWGLRFGSRGHSGPHCTHGPLAYAFLPLQSYIEPAVICLIPPCSPGPCRAVGTTCSASGSCCPSGGSDVSCAKTDYLAPAGKCRTVCPLATLLFCVLVCMASRLSCGMPLIKLCLSLRCSAYPTASTSTNAARAATRAMSANPRWRALRAGKREWCL